MVHSVEDIREAILFARKFNLKVTVKSSGHDFHGRCSIDGSFTINLMEMKKMQVTDTATERSEYGELKVETGATWKEIYEEVNIVTTQNVKCTNFFIFALAFTRNLDIFTF